MHYFVQWGNRVVLLRVAWHYLMTLSGWMAGWWWMRGGGLTQQISQCPPTFLFGRIPHIFFPIHSISWQGVCAGCKLDIPALTWGDWEDVVVPNGAARQAERVVAQTWCFLALVLRSIIPSNAVCHSISSVVWTDHRLRRVNVVPFHADWLRCFDFCAEGVSQSPSVGK